MIGPEITEIPEEVQMTALLLLHKLRMLQGEPSDAKVAAIAAYLLDRDERAAKIAENYSCMEHTAFDIRSKSFPTKSPIQDFIAKQIRGQGSFESGANAAANSPALAKSSHEEAAQGSEND